MATKLPEPKLLLLLFVLLTTTVSGGEHRRFSRNLSSKSLGLGKEKLSHLHFYFHDILSGKNPTAIKIVSPDGNKLQLSSFGSMYMADDPLTLGPEMNSTLLGRAQGIYATASQTDIAFLMVFNIHFTEGKYNGSNLSLLGRNPVLNEVREMSIVGGSGLFRFARGYAQAKTVWFNNKGDATVEYNVYVFHY